MIWFGIYSSDQLEVKRLESKNKNEGHLHSRNFRLCVHIPEEDDPYFNNNQE